jgi:uncharacterized protein
MPAQTVIDSLEFARTGQTLRGSLPVLGLSRLKDNLVDAPGAVEFVVKGGYDARRRLTLTLDVSGMLHLQCQRCLGVLEFPLRLRNTLLLAGAREAATADLDEEEIEWIEARAELDVAALVEDEIILSLPYAARHEEGFCGHDQKTAAGGDGASAFAQLAALKQNSTTIKER